MNILDEAAELINGQRAQDYGPVTENFERIADLWNSYLGISAIDHYDVANLMILVKLARVRNAGYHRDSYADIAGYAALAEKVHAELELSPPTQDFWEDIDQSIVEAQEKRERDRTSRPPRVWESIHDVPEGAVVADAGGMLWRFKDGVRYLGDESGSWDPGAEIEQPSDNDWVDDYAPFTEVLDTEQKGTE